jgi:hypothetical protein
MVEIMEWKHEKLRKADVETALIWLNACRPENVPPLTKEELFNLCRYTIISEHIWEQLLWCRDGTFKGEL